MLRIRPLSSTISVICTVLDDLPYLEVYLHVYVFDSKYVQYPKHPGFSYQGQKFHNLNRNSRTAQSRFHSLGQNDILAVKNPLSLS
jgi:hypothetical protein